MRATSEGRIPADHPSLAGHFPGYPIVPGVLLLDAVIEAAARHLGTTPAAVALPNAKFVAPLEPAVAFTIELSGSAAGALGFVVKTADRTIASGTVRCSSGSEAA